MHKIHLYIFFCVQFFSIAQAQADTVFVSTDVPRPIPDGPSGIAESYLSIGISREVLDINVVLSITHPFTGDLRLYLEAPDEDVVRLSNRCGFNGDNYIETRFDDEATTFICDAFPPFNGSFYPDQPLYVFDGLSTYGLWTLRVTDNAEDDIGTITAWRLEMMLGDTLLTDQPPEGLPANFIFFGNYPNPFNASTEFIFTLSRDSDVALDLFDILGRHTVSILRANAVAGEHRVQYDAAQLTSGIYFAQLTASGQSATHKIILER